MEFLKENDMGKVRAKVKAREKRRAREAKNDSGTVIMFKRMKFVAERAAPPIMPMNNRQAEYLACLRAHPQVFVLGPAGTGKTWIAASHAADLYRSGSIGKIILTRPNVPCGRSLGFFPGTLESKFAPWTVPVTDAIRDRLGKAVYDLAVKNGDIEVVPFEVMRGRSWRDAFILLDEAQNTSVTEIKMFLTRIGEGCTTVINGDIAQCDLPQGSGLHIAINLVRQRNLPVPVVEFTAEDIVRSGLCAMWVRAFDEMGAPALAL
jgi:phosphate starvation-inducible protein PhoH and related proteins